MASFLRFGSENTEITPGTSLNDAWKAHAEDVSGDPDASVKFRSRGQDVDGSMLAEDDVVYVAALRGEDKGA